MRRRGWVSQSGLLRGYMGHEKPRPYGCCALASSSDLFRDVMFQIRCVRLGSETRPLEAYEADCRDDSRIIPIGIIGGMFHETFSYR
jgi:hypothetical protein